MTRGEAGNRAAKALRVAAVLGTAIEETRVPGDDSVSEIAHSLNRSSFELAAKRAGWDTISDQTIAAVKAILEEQDRLSEVGA